MGEGSPSSPGRAPARRQKGMFPPNSKSIEELWQEDDLRFDKLLLKYDHNQSQELPDEFFVQDVVSSTPSQNPE